MATTPAFGTPGSLGYVNPFAPAALPNNGSTAPINTTITRTSSPVTPAPGTPNTVSSPAPQPAPQKVSSTAQTSPPVNTSLQMTPAEASGGASGIAAYNARIAASNPNLPAPGTTSSTGVTNSAQPAGLASSVINQNIGTPATQNVNQNIGSTGAAGNTFSSYVNQLGNTSAKGSPVANEAATGLLNTGQTSSGYTEALANYQKAVQDLKNFDSNVAGQFGKMETSDQALPVVLGQEGALNKQYASQRAALQDAISSSATALNAGISEQGAVQTGLNEAGNLGNTAQSTAQSGLNAAGQLSSPSGNFPFVFSPLTQSFSNSSSGSSLPSGFTGNPQNDAATVAAAVMGHQISYNDAQSALHSYYGNTADSYLTQAIISKGGNPTNLQSQAQGTASVLGNIPAMQGANTAAKGIQQQITSLINSNPTINAGGNVALINAAQQWLQGKQLTDPTYQTLFDDLGEYTSTLAPILGVGGDVTNLKTQIAQSFINPQASGGSILTVLNNIGALADSKVPNLQSGATGGGVVSSAPQIGGGSSGSTIKTSYGSINPNL